MSVVSYIQGMRARVVIVHAVAAAIVEACEAVIDSLDISEKAELVCGERESCVCPPPEDTSGEATGIRCPYCRAEHDGRPSKWARPSQLFCGECCKYFSHLGVH